MAFVYTYMCVSGYRKHWTVAKQQPQHSVHSANAKVYKIKTFVHISDANDDYDYSKVMCIYVLDYGLLILSFSSTTLQTLAQQTFLHHLHLASLVTVPFEIVTFSVGCVMLQCDVIIQFRQTKRKERGLFILSDKFTRVCVRSSNVSLICHRRHS